MGPFWLKNFKTNYLLLIITEKPHFGPTVVAFGPKSSKQCFSPKKYLSQFKVSMPLQLHTKNQKNQNIFFKRLGFFFWARRSLTFRQLHRVCIHSEMHMRHDKSYSQNPPTFNLDATLIAHKKSDNSKDWFLGKTRHKQTNTQKLFHRIFTLWVH